MQPASGDAAIPFSALDARALLSRLFHSEGIVSPDVVFGALKVTQRAAGANFSVDIAAGACVIIGDDVSDQGYYLCESTAVTNVVIPGPPGSGTRVHRIVARVKDKLHNGSWTTYEWTLECLQDTGSGTPATPNTAISLATVSVAAAQASVTNANITDTRASASLITSKYPLVGADTSRPPNPYESELIWRTDGKLIEVWNGSAWRTIPTAPGPDLFARKTADTTRNNTNTVANDPHLTVTAAANAVYRFQGFLAYQGASSTSDIAFAWAIPSGATILWVPRGLSPVDADQNTGQQAGYLRMSATSGTTQRSAGTVAATGLVATPEGILVTGASSGSFTLQWAQNSAVAENTTLLTNSHIYLRRVA